MISSDDYKAASTLLEANAQNLVRNIKVEPDWIGDSGRFWYRRDGRSGPEYVVVDVNSGVSEPAFDHAALAEAVSAVVGESVAAHELDFATLEISSGQRLLTASLRGTRIHCDLEAMTCTSEPGADVGRPALQSSSGRFQVFIADHNLWLEERGSNLRQLTQDGEPYFAYAKAPDSALVAIESQSRPQAPYGAAFSPDERYLVVPRVDEREVAASPFVEWAPADGRIRPKLFEVRTPITGDPPLPIEFFAIEIASGKSVRFDLPDDLSPGVFDAPIVGWGGGEVYLYLRDFGSRRLLLIAVELATGKVRELIREEGDTRVEPNANMSNHPNIRVLGDGEELIWYSCRSGWGHLYLVDGQSGETKRAITSGAWAIHDIMEIDLERREIYVTGGGRESGRDPYFRHLYRVSLDQDEVVLLTDIDADHHFDPPRSEIYGQMHGTVERPVQLIRPDLGVFIDTWSTVEQPPVTHLRSTEDGAVHCCPRASRCLCVVCRRMAGAHTSCVKGSGWSDRYLRSLFPAVARDSRRQAPGDRFCLRRRTGGRGAEELHPGLSRCQSPMARAPWLASDSGSSRSTAAGTPHRSAAFRDAGYPEFTRVGIQDHVAAIRQLAASHPEMDLDKVGVYGWSWGGTFSAQALLSQPDFYRVAVAGTGVYDYAGMIQFYEAYITPPDYGDGGTLRSAANQKPENWDHLDITRMAHRLRGKLLLISSELDENVPPNQAVRLIRALMGCWQAL